MHPIKPWSRLAGRMAVLGPVAVLVACSVVPKLATVDQAQARLTGMTATQVAGCMGTAGTQRTTSNGLVVWTYTPGPNAMSIPQPQTDPSHATFGYTPFAGPVGGQSMAAAVAPPPSASCVVVLTLDNGRVIGVTYTGADGGPPAQTDACAALVGPCMP